MYKRKLERDIHCPLEYGLSILGGKWKSRILCVLGTSGPMRYSDLRTALGNITDAVLSGALRELNEENMVERIQFEEIPPRVEYSLTERGRSALPILKAIAQWAGALPRKDVPADAVHCQRCDYQAPEKP